MADEQAERLYKRKRLKNPNDENQYIDIPVIYKATFKTMAEQAQERAWYIRNDTDGGTRKVRVQTVKNPNDTSQQINVERIESLLTKTVTEQAQEHQWYIKNDEPPPATWVEGEGLVDNPSHEKKHFVRYTGKKLVDGEPQDDPGTWCDVELIDVLKLKCTTEQAQEYLLYARWPDPDQQDPVVDPQDPFQPLTTATCDPELELIEGPQTDDAGVEFDPPYRLDPFQNIVNIHWSTHSLIQPVFLVFIIPGATGAVDFFANYDWPDIDVHAETPPSNAVNYFLSFVSALVGCTTNVQTVLGVRVPVSGLPGTTFPGGSSSLEFFRLFNPQLDDIWPESALGLPFEGSSVAGMTVNIVFEYSTFSASDIQRWEYYLPGGAGGLQRFTGGLMPGAIQHESTSVDCSAFSFTMDGHPYEHTGPLTFHTFRVTEERSLGPVPSKYYIAHMESELGHPPNY